ncbi:autophagy-related protein 16 [Cercophora newfieldiana]|uniref:Autophagy-related protein 16 n=1 Tax=Cercophora newfieldiana TaxID=92897 RepID=A0AA39Y4U6_9PEZI|nr:autophagy-related protein 16 [Cercophora newfieldiana]
MAGWREEFLASIFEAEQQHPVDHELITACSQLADRVSTLEAEKIALVIQHQAAPSSTPGRSTSRDGKSKDSSRSEHSDPNSETPLVARLRLELAEALRARGQFQTRLQMAEDELTRLRTKTSSDGKSLRDLNTERKVLARKLKDREEELRAKNKLVADVQDELAVLNMQLDQVEKQLGIKEAENKQLVERFMKRVAEEADAMNLASEPLFAKKRSK